MHSVLQSHHQPTTVDYAVKCNFFNDFEINLVTASSSIINVYKFYEVTTKVCRLLYIIIGLWSSSKLLQILMLYLLILLT